MNEKAYKSKRDKLFGLASAVTALSIFLSIILYFCILTPPRGWSASPYQFSTDEENVIKLILFSLPFLTAVIMLVWYCIKLIILKKNVKKQGKV
jgi:hypothetical protein